MEMTITTTMIQDDLYDARNEAGNHIRVDMRKNGEKEFLSPTELLLSGVAGCSAVDLVSMLKKRRKTITRLTIETKGQRRDEPPKYFTSIHCVYRIVSPDVTEDEASKTAAMALEKYCSVASSLKSTITFSVEITRE